MCRQCGSNRPASDYYASKPRVCKLCVRAAVTRNRQERIDYYRAYDRARGNRQSREYQRQYRAENHEKYKAQNAVNNAVRDGRLKKPSRCEGCGAKKRLHGHHDDYTQPLDVRWLCVPCHAEAHKMSNT